MKHLLYTLAIASGSLLALNANAKVGDLLPRPHQIELTAGAAPFALQRTVAITDPTGCTYLKNFFTANGCTIAAAGESAAATVTVSLASAIDGAYDYEVANSSRKAPTVNRLRKKTSPSTSPLQAPPA